MAKHLKVSGRVQGVGFRFRTQQTALEHNLVGWVKNEADGTVEMEIAGANDDMDRFTNDVKSGFDQIIHVDEVQVNTTDKTVKDFDGFNIEH